MEGASPRRGAIAQLTDVTVCPWNGNATLYSQNGGRCSGQCSHRHEEECTDNEVGRGGGDGMAVRRSVHTFNADAATQFMTMAATRQVMRTVRLMMVLRTPIDAEDAAGDAGSSGGDGHGEDERAAGC